MSLSTITKLKSQHIWRNKQK